MRLISLVNFPDETAEALTSVLARLGFGTRRGRTPEQLKTDDAAVFVWGESAGFLEAISQIRAVHRKTFITIATRLPDYATWMDGLEAGANDYCCIGAGAEKLGWLLQPEAPFRLAAPPLLQQAA